MIALGFLLVFFEKATLTELTAFFVGAFALLFLKDPKDGDQKSGSK